jgi:large subunit ribosomal protein L31e
MAKKKEEAKIVLERVYTVPLRREFLKVPRYKRAVKAMRALRAFLEKHMKSDNVKIGKYLSMFITKHGMKNPPHHVKVTAAKDSEGMVKAELVGAPKEEKIEEKKAKPQKKVIEAKAETVEETKAEEPRIAEKPEHPKKKAKPLEAEITE